jgi:formyltetrahydrofolate-dependent phosphoribosylglycinamide formyltransferase
VNDLRIAFLVSGNGTLFEHLTVKMREGAINATPALVISSHPGAPAIERARRLDVPCTVLRREDYATEEEFCRAILDTLNQHHVNFVCLAGYLKLVPHSIVERFRHRMLNIHPALLPAFGGKGMYGRKVFEAAIEYGVRIHGVTVHLVDDEYDHGPIVLQRAVFVALDDTPDTLQARVHSIEYDLYADAVKLFAADRVQVNGRRVHLLPAQPQS